MAIMASSNSSARAPRRSKGAPTASNSSRDQPHAAAHFQLSPPRRRESPNAARAGSAGWYGKTSALVPNRTLRVCAATKVNVSIGSKTFWKLTGQLPSRDGGYGSRGLIGHNNRSNTPDRIVADFFAARLVDPDQIFARGERAALRQCATDLHCDLLICVPLKCGIECATQSISLLI